MGELGGEPHIIDALQNHKLPQSTSVTGTYNVSVRRSAC
jgi:hypothetical protein